MVLRGSPADVAFKYQLLQEWMTRVTNYETIFTDKQQVHPVTSYWSVRDCQTVYNCWITSEWILYIHKCVSVYYAAEENRRGGSGQRGSHCEVGNHVRVTLGRNMGKKKLCGDAASKSHLLGLQKQPLKTAAEFGITCPSCCNTKSVVSRLKLLLQQWTEATRWRRGV